MLWNTFSEDCVKSGMKTVKVFTDTSSSCDFYEERDFTEI